MHLICFLHLQLFDIHFHGGEIWLDNLFDSEVSGAIKYSLNGEVCKQAVEDINTQGNKAINSLPVQSTKQP